MQTKDKISFSDFLSIQEKLDIRVGQIVRVEKVPKSDKLLKLSVIFDMDHEKTVITNIGSTITPEHLLGLTMPFIVNLEELMKYI